MVRGTDDQCKSKALIMMTTYNGEAFLEKQIESILKQTYKNWDLVISDNGSTDNTLGILKRYQKTDARIKVILENNISKGAYRNYFFLMKYVKQNYGNDYDYYFYCDQDDIWCLEKIELEIKLLEAYINKPALCYSDVEFIDINGNSIGKNASDIRSMDVNNQLDFLFEFKYLLGTSMAHNKELWKKLKIPSDDHIEIRHDQYIRKYAALAGIIKYLPRVLVKYRRHDSNVSRMLVKYSFNMALHKLATEFPKIFRNTALHFACANVFLSNIEDINEIVRDYRKAVSKNGIYAVSFLRKYNITISDNIYERIMYKLLFFTGIYKIIRL